MSLAMCLIFSFISLSINSLAHYFFILIILTKTFAILKYFNNGNA